MRSVDEIAHALYRQLIAYPEGRSILGVATNELLRLAVRSMVCPRCRGPVGEARNECMTCANLANWKQTIESSETRNA